MFRNVEFAEEQTNNMCDTTSDATVSFLCQRQYWVQSEMVRQIMSIKRRNADYECSEDIYVIVA